MLHIFVESPFDKQLLDRLLEDLPTPHQFLVHASNGRDAARPVARKYLLVYREPVVFVFDADNRDEAYVRRQQRDYEDYLRWGGHGIPFKVVQFVPELAVIFFEQPGPLERLLGHALDVQSKVAGRFAPMEILRDFCSELTMRSPSDLVTRLSENDLRDLRSGKTIADLRDFVIQESAISQAG